MPKRISPEDWKPVGIDSLEPAAEAAVRDLHNTIVVAGPGAGKTELLAQRACFLLQTWLCPPPKRILAISFKRDAARNLRERVARRCGVEMARRFDSLTFDSFSKSLLDRFYLGLPNTFRPTEDYEVKLDLGHAKSVRAVLNRIRAHAPGQVDAIVQARAEERFFKRFVVNRPLEASAFSVENENDVLAVQFWQFALRGQKRSMLNFQMIGRLAELVIRHNPKLLEALRSTYGFVFLDEFQDTTNVQYDLTVTAFRGAPAILTAVGDNKQRIMVWAGALDGVFEQFRMDFQAIPRGLAMNYRSAPELVRIQRFLIASLDPSCPMPVAFHDGSDGNGECRALEYRDHQKESEHLAGLLAAEVLSGKLKPRDICVLTRNRPDRYGHYLCQELAKRNVRARVENELQDLLTEPLVVLLLDLSQLAISPRSPSAWGNVMDVLLDLRGYRDKGHNARRLEKSLSVFITDLRSTIQACRADEDAVLSVLKREMEFVDSFAFRQKFSQYKQGDWYETALLGLARQLAARLKDRLDWQFAIDDLAGVDCIPVMTIHKSKGLEYHTVVFVGLEDSALWGFASAPEEEKCGFFVAFSRAMKRVILTFSESRPRVPGGIAEAQSRQKIGILYELLEQAGVKPEKVL